VQVNQDFGSEADMVKKFRVSLRCSRSPPRCSPPRPSWKESPTASCPIRSQIWTDTDPDRTGMLPFVFEDGMGLRALCRLCARRADVFRQS
jgi:glutamate--cysteine ligase